MSTSSASAISSGVDVEERCRTRWARHGPEIHGGSECELFEQNEILFDDVGEMVRKIDILDDYWSD